MRPAILPANLTRTSTATNAYGIAIRTCRICITRIGIE
jgi:hypothetical protein